MLMMQFLHVFKRCNQQIKPVSDSSPLSVSLQTTPWFIYHLVLSSQQKQDCVCVKNPPVVTLLCEKVSVCTCAFPPCRQRRAHTMTSPRKRRKAWAQRRTIAHHMCGELIPRARRTTGGSAHCWTFSPFPLVEGQWSTRRRGGRTGRCQQVYLFIFWGTQEYWETTTISEELTSQEAN